MAVYYAFLSLEDENERYGDMTIPGVSSKQEARGKLANYFKSRGMKAELSETSEEVYITLQDGKEIVYYGFDTI